MWRPCFPCDSFPFPSLGKHAGRVVITVQSTLSFTQIALKLPQTLTPPLQPDRGAVNRPQWPPSKLSAFGEGEGWLGSACSPHLYTLQSLLPLSPGILSWLWQEAAGKSCLSPRSPGVGYIWMLKVMTHLHEVLPPACLMW